jgi:tRNA-uridine 2-sulfurtransferase
MAGHVSALPWRAFLAETRRRHSDRRAWRNHRKRRSRLRTRFEEVARYPYIAAMNMLDPETDAAATRVVVAMSGGVDSSVTAALLAEAGCEVIGITLQLYDHGQAVARPGSCCAGQDIHDARRVADRLGIPHYVLDYEERFRAQVIDDFAQTYVAGETPIPCVRCNQRIKFDELLRTARELGADALATGHYVERRESRSGPALYRAAETLRDQSYFLFATTREQLAFLRFPLGGLPKDETRAIARRLGLPVAEKKDSQDICFVPSGKYTHVVRRLRPDAQRSGEIVDLHGRALGCHAGIAQFTIGQRRGLGVSSDRPLYVVRLEPATARVVVGPFEALLRDRIVVREVNWLGDQPLPAAGVRVEVKLRSTMPPVPANVDIDAQGGAEVRLDEPQAGVAPGQACVFYRENRLLGGGWIARQDNSVS